MFAGDTGYDTAAFTSTPPPTGGTITFYDYTGAGCTGTQKMIGTPINVPQPSGSGLYSSAQATFSQPGSYYFSASYSGSATDAPSQSLCETLTVLPATSSSSSSSSTTTTSTTTTPTTPSEGGGIGSTDLLIGVGVIVVLLAAGGYLFMRRGKQ